ncbi:MAG TPA: 4Fe-4S dicluster domain-containing protein, partial [Phycisphaerales bacterium]|nr:4Fe-4S dicluster domain-containing protein [Phycisphaerales bacterium]
MTEDFWNGLPTRWYVAVPFLLVCGVASVYFLGARALCRYGCPYAGLLDPAEKLAPVSVVVDPALCDRCGLCTASCSVGVRVMDEVNRYGSVVNSRCIRSLDCVSVCPQRALSLGFTTPAAIKSLRGQRAINAFSLTLAEEATATGAGMTTFFAARGAYGLVPMLMAVGVSICTAAAAVACLRLFSTPNVRFLGAQLKRAGAVRSAGRVALALFLGWCILLAQAATVQLLHRRAAAIVSRAAIASAPTSESIAPANLDPSQVQRALDLYRLAGPLTDGGIALLSTPGADVAAARLLLASGQASQAVRTARRAIDREGADDALAVLYASALAGAHSPSEATAWLLGHVETHAGHAESRRAVVDALIFDGRFDDAVTLLERLATRETRRGSVHAELARLLIADGRTAPALAAIRKAAALSPADRAIATDAVAIEAIGGDRSACARAIERLRPLAGDDLSEQLAALGSVLDGQGLSRAAQVLAEAHKQAATTSGSPAPGPPAR